MKLLRRIMAALTMAGIAAAGLRVRGRGGTPPQHGGWRPLELPPPARRSASVDAARLMRVWIVGRGIVGRRIERMLHDVEVLFHDTRVEPTPPAEPGDVVVLAHPVDHAPLAHAFAMRGASVVTVGDGLDDIRELMALDREFAASGSTLVVGAGLTPGLSGLIARHLANDLDQLDEIHVAVHGTAGPNCARDYHRSLSGRAVSWRDGAWHRSLGGWGPRAVLVSRAGRRARLLPRGDCEPCLVASLVS